MYGSPKDVAGQCNARLYIGDDNNESQATMRCELEPGHTGLHRQQYTSYDNLITVTWILDEGCMDLDMLDIEDAVKDLCGR